MHLIYIALLKDTLHHIMKHTKIYTIKVTKMTINHILFHIKSSSEQVGFDFFFENGKVGAVQIK